MDSLNDFEQFLLRKNKSKLTIDSYLYDLKVFLQYIKENKLEVNKEIIKNYIDCMINSGKKNTTINRYIVTLNHYMEFLHINYKLKQEKIHIQNFLDDIISVDEYIKLIKMAESQKDYRAKCLYMTLFLTGMRVSEALQLTIYDIDKKQIIIKGKGSKYREVFIPEKLRDAWREYSHYRIKKTNKLFTGQKGAITRQTVHVIIKKYAKLCDIDESKLHCHIFRHLCGKALSEYVDIDTLADILGHSNINITKIYTRKTKKELLDIVNKL